MLVTDVAVCVQVLPESCTHTGVANCPCSQDAVGTVGLNVEYVMMRRPSWEKKKNVLSFLIGPPIVPPKSFHRSGGTCATPSTTLIRVALLTKLLATK